ncbi:MAG: hypothetical protein WAN87_06445 [Thermoplasmata archaeon]
MADSSTSPNDRASEGALTGRAILTAPAGKPAGSNVKGLVIFTGAAVIFVVIILVFAGVIPLIPTDNGGHAPRLMTEQSALPLAVTYANNVSGGPWLFQEAVGFDTTLEFTLLLGLTPCPLDGPRLANFTLSGYNGSYSSGLAEGWLLEFVPASGSGAALLLLARNGTIEELGKVPSPILVISLPACNDIAPYPIPVGAYNSTAAALAVTTTPNGSAYIAAHLYQNATYDLRMLGENNSSLIPMWFITFSGCSGHNETALLASVYAVNNTVVDTSVFPSSPSSSCGAPMNETAAAFQVVNAMTRSAIR